MPKEGSGWVGGGERGDLFFATRVAGEEERALLGGSGNGRGRGKMRWGRERERDRDRMRDFEIEEGEVLNGEEGDDHEVVRLMSPLPGR